MKKTSKTERTPSWLNSKIAEARKEVRSWGDTRNGDYWKDTGKLEAFLEVRKELKRIYSRSAIL